MFWRGVTGLALTLALGGAVAAQSGPPDTATLVADAQALKLVSDATDKGGILAVQPHEGALRAILAHQPHPFEDPQRIRDTLYFRTQTIADCLIMLTLTQKMNAKKGVCVDNPYPKAAFLLGSYYNEIQRPDVSLPILSGQLKDAPGDTVLASETAAAYVLAKRMDDALTTYQTGLDNAGLFATDHDKALLLRGKGFALTELRRYDEAETAYRQSLVLQPGHGGALRELKYIAQVKSGGATAPYGVVNGEQAKKP